MTFTPNRIALILQIAITLVIIDLFTASAQTASPSQQWAPWLDVPMNAPASAQTLISRSSRPTPEARMSKILVGPHIGDGTILELTGVDGDKARVTFRREMDDVTETCEREGDPENKKAIARCIAHGFREEARRVTTRRAYCSRLTLYTEFGNYSMVAWRQDEIGIQTDWKNHRNEQIIGNCNGCNTPQLLDTLKVLCPTQYRDTFGSKEPY